ILDRDDVVVVGFVNQIDNGCKCRTLPAARWSSHKDDAVFQIYYLLQLFGQIEITELRRSHRDHAHDNRVRSTLLENIDAKTRVAGNAERIVSRTGFFETVDCRLLITDD